MNPLNKYFELKDNKISSVDDYNVVESRETVRWSLSGDNFICKTREGIIASGVLNPSTALDEDELKTLLRSSEYNI